MIHKIKAMHSKGSGLSIRAISRELNISRNTVKKYLQMDEQAISILQADPSRYKWLDHYRDYLINLLNQQAITKQAQSRKRSAPVGGSANNAYHIKSSGI